MTVFEKAKKEYNSIMFSICCEFATIGTDYSEGTENWTIRDMVQEASYHLECCYEDGNANADGRYISRYMEMYNTDREEAEYAHNEWLTKTRRLRAFINRYKKEAAR